MAENLVQVPDKPVPNSFIAGFPPISLGPWATIFHKIRAIAHNWATGARRHCLRGYHGYLPYMVMQVFWPQLYCQPHVKPSLTLLPFGGVLRPKYLHYHIWKVGAKHPETTGSGVDIIDNCLLHPQCQAARKENGRKPGTSSKQTCTKQLCYWNSTGFSRFLGK
ncbi:hypothetical protein R3P38DRAFT_2775743 [Favolaschia claudopus]|uniref:Uncharacterized protein n=1 Tax=Favolaschia claudopus TaxID=2862362 RepID=A0AAW0BR64_9AGAR